MHPKGRCGRPASPIQMLQIVPLFSISFQPIQKKLHLSERSVAISWGIFLWFFFVVYALLLSAIHCPDSGLPIIGLKKSTET